MFCENCGAVISEGRRFCPACGMPVPVDARPGSPASAPRDGSLHVRVAQPTSSASAVREPRPAPEYTAPVAPEDTPRSGFHVRQNSPDTVPPPEPVLEEEDVRVYHPREPEPSVQVSAAFTPRPVAPASPRIDAPPVRPAAVNVAPAAESIRSDISGGRRPPRAPEPGPEVHSLLRDPPPEAQSIPAPVPTPAVTGDSLPDGEEANRKKAKRILLYALCGLLLVAAILLIVLVVRDQATNRPSSSESSLPGASESGSSVSGESTGNSSGEALPQVPAVVGQTGDIALQTLTNAGYEVQTNEAYDDTVEPGRVISQVPASGSGLAKGAVVTITVSLGPDLSSSVIVWNDPTVEQAVRVYLNKGVGDLTGADLDGIHTLVLDGSVCLINPEEIVFSENPGTMSSLEDLKYFQNLEALYLYSQPVQTLEFASAMLSLRTLSVDGGAVSDLSPLTSLSGLTSLTLASCGLTDLIPLAELTGLTSLDLSGNPLGDLTPLASLTGLTSLSLDNVGTPSLLPLIGLTSLDSLSLDGDNLSDVSMLASLPTLNTLSLAKNRLSQLNQLSAMTGLTTLNLRGNGISSLSGLEYLYALQELDLGGNSITNIGELAHLTSLQTLNLDYMTIKDLSPLYGCSHLTYLSIKAPSGSVPFLGDPYSEIKQRLPRLQVVTK